MKFFYYLLALGAALYSICNAREAITISSSKGVFLNQHGSKYRKKVTKPLIIAYDAHEIKLNNKQLNPGLWHLTPHNGKIIINDKPYYGSATLHIQHSSLVIDVQSKKGSLVHLSWNRSKQTSSNNPISSQSEVRVLISELSSHQASTTISSETGFMIIDPFQPSVRKYIKKTMLKVSYSPHAIILNGIPFAQKLLHLKSQSNSLGLHDHKYHGSISLLIKNNKLLIINHVDLEEYVYAVLKTESWPGWPIEVNKAFAIASRSYAYAMIDLANKKNKPYHVKNTNEHQTYKGMHSTSTIRTAVEQTEGICLIFNNKPALAMFDSCCGGVIPAHISEFDFTKAPYLARKHPCKYCKRCWIYSWKKEISLNDINHYIGNYLKKPTTIKEIKIIKKDKAGLVKEVLIKYGKERIVLNGKKFYALIKDIKSFYYTVQKKKNTVIFSGRGYGHHLGICQWGAREMVRDGWTYKRILDFYYPGTKLQKLM